MERKKCDFCDKWMLPMTLYEGKNRYYICPYCERVVGIVINDAQQD